MHKMKCPANSEEEPNYRGPQRNSTQNNANVEVDFSEFEWMGEENLEEFDRKVLCFLKSDVQNSIDLGVTCVPITNHLPSYLLINSNNHLIMNYC